MASLARWRRPPPVLAQVPARLPAAHAAGATHSLDYQLCLLGRKAAVRLTNDVVAVNDFIRTHFARKPGEEASVTVLGLDAEWPPTSSSDHTSLFQIASRDAVLLLHSATLQCAAPEARAREGDARFPMGRFMTPAPVELVRLVTDPGVVMAGVNVRGDAVRLLGAMGIRRGRGGGGGGNNNNNNRRGGGSGGSGAGTSSNGSGSGSGGGEAPAPGAADSASSSTPSPRFPAAALSGSVSMNEAEWLLPWGRPLPSVFRIGEINDLRVAGVNMLGPAVGRWLSPLSFGAPPPSTAPTVTRPMISLERAARILCGVPPWKSRHVSMSNWDALPLGDSRVLYAAMDGWMSLLVFEQLRDAAAAVARDAAAEKAAAAAAAAAAGAGSAGGSEEAPLVSSSGDEVPGASARLHVSGVASVVEASVAEAAMEPHGSKRRVAATPATSWTAFHTTNDILLE